MKRLLPFIVLILLILGGIFSVPFLLRPESHRAEITDALSKLFKRPVVIGTITMGYLPPTLRLNQIAVMKEDGTPALQIDSAEAPLDWAALFHLQLLPSGLELKHWVLTTLRKVDGSWDVEEWLSSASGVSGTKAWLVQMISWKDGEIHALDRYAGVPQELVMGSLEGSWDVKKNALKTTGAFKGLGAPAKLSLTAAGQFFSNPKWSGDLNLTDQANSLTFHIDKQAGSCDVKGGAPRWGFANALAFVKFYGRGTAAESAGALTLENWQLHAHSEAGALTFEHQAGISGGVSEIKGHAERQPAGLLTHADVALKDVPAEALLSAAGENVPLMGKVTALAKDFELLLSSRTSSTLKGQGAFELNDGRYKLPDVSIQKLAKAKTMKYLKNKFPDMEQNGIPLAKLAVQWQAKDGIITVNEGFIASTDMKAGWAGAIDIPRQGVDVYLRLQIHEKDTKLSPLIPLKYRTQPAYGRLQGTWQEWTIRAFPSSKIPSAAQSKLRKVINQK